MWPAKRFLSTLSLRRATNPRFFSSFFWLFLSTLSLRRATGSLSNGMTSTSYFYPRSPCGERQTFIILPKQLYNFYPRSPCGERRTKKLRIPVPAYFYPRSPCGERLYDTYAKVLRVNISIHALLAESDWPGLLARPFFLISIHALLAESDSV